MKQIIIIEDDIHLAHEMQENINSIENMHCRHVFINPIDYLENPIEADFFLLDIVMPEMNGLEMIERILKLYPKSVIIMNTIQDDSETIFKALQLGASGYIDKQSFETKFTEVFECIGNGGAYMTPKIARRVIEFFNNPRTIMQELTVREKDIVNGILDGLSYKMIANKHELAIDTVRMYVKKVYRKLSINSKSELFKLMRSRL
jgi:DNA-binding NarL/FixJ family response regulator